MMIVSAVPSLWIGLIGWVATLLVITNSARLTPGARGMLGVVSWTLWMTPAFGILVSRGALPLLTALLYIGATTGGMAVVMRAVSTPRTDP